MKLCLFKVAKSDACIRPLFTNLVTIYGAAYGPRDVTAIVRKNLRKDQKLSFTVSNDTFGGDPWPDNRKSFVVIYKYNTVDSVKTAIVKEGDHLTINPPSALSSFPKD